MEYEELSDGSSPEIALSLVLAVGMFWLYKKFFRKSLQKDNDIPKSKSELSIFREKYGCFAVSIIFLSIYLLSLYVFSILGLDSIFTNSLCFFIPAVVIDKFLAIQ